MQNARGRKRVQDGGEHGFNKSHELFYYKHTLNKQHTLSIMEKQGHVNTDHILKVVEIRVHLSANGKVMPNVSNA